ncbi:MAG: D-aminoacyl-tRNA deacylase [Eubacteriales bacterium]|mgnify:CR=1 FL=1|nr:D-aminoacyl-tRNA deacylase [Eubacteriales bacterium]
MRAVIQRVKSACVSVAQQTVGKCEQGCLVLLGVGKEDTEQDASLLADKIVKLRIFSDPEGKMNHSLLEFGYSVLLVSQFTLYGDCTHGNRPSFLESAPAKQAQPLYESFATHLRAYGISVECGVFGADMTIEPVCDGPVTILLDTQQLRHSKV